MTVPARADVAYRGVTNPATNPASSGRHVRAVVGVLADGTPHYAPVGTVPADGAHVMCHLCGRWYRSVLTHLRAHGWDQATYREAFGLQRNQPLEGNDTRKRRSTALHARRVFEPAIRRGSANGAARARSGQLSRDAARANRGRRQPEQRRRRTAHNLASAAPNKVAAIRRRAQHRREQLATEAARRQGYPDIGALVCARVRAGASLAAISRELGLHKDWLCRHLDATDPDAADAARSGRRARHDSRWWPIIQRFGFTDVAAFLHDRHTVRGHTVNAIAREVGLSRSAVESALRRHGLGRIKHAGTRRRRDARARAVSVRFGYADIGAYVAERRAAGLSWQAVARECGQPESWLRRQCGHGAGDHRTGT